MRKKRKTKISKGGLYIALCGCAVVLATFGYVGKKASEIKDLEIEDLDTEEIAYSISDEDLFEFDNIKSEEKEPPKKEEAIKKEEPKKEEIKEPTTVSVSGKQEVEEFVLTMPVEGKVILEFSDGELLFNEKLSDWRAHNGIDISCEENSAIFASADGVIKKIYENEMGKSVVIDHKNGYETVYSSLSDDIAIKEGQEIKAGDLIAKAGKSAFGDFSDSVHLHFELLSDGKHINPVDFIK